jgi:hypothetical protein
VRVRRYAAGVGLSLSLLAGTVACAGDDPEPAASSPEEPAEGTAAAASALPEPGTPADPAPVEPVVEPLEWTDVGGVGEETVTAGSAYTVRIPVGGRRAELEGPEGGTFTAPPGYRWSQGLLDEEHAVLVAQEETETRPAHAVVVDLADGSTRTLDGDTEPATTNGGTWALGQGVVLHATYGPDREYCLAEVDLGTGEGRTTYCAEPGTGFNEARVTPEAVSLLVFDSGTPSCRTVVEVDGTSAQPFPGVPDCTAWEGLLLPDGAAWTVVPRETRIERSVVRARVGDGWYDLGPALSGSLVWCHGAAWFSQDQETETGPARVLRWDGTALTTVLEVGDGGPASVSAPRCGGDGIAVSVLAETGDQQLVAPLG